MPKVKPLEWDYLESNLADGSGRPMWTADGYWAYYAESGKWLLCEDITPEWLPASPYLGTFDTAEEAKTAAQERHEEFILSQLCEEPDYEETLTSIIKGIGALDTLESEDEELLVRSEVFAVIYSVVAGE